MSATIKLRSSDLELFDVELDVAKKSITIKVMVEDLDRVDVPVPLCNVTGEVLRLVIEWCVQHRDDPAELEDAEPSTDDISEWDRQFIERNRRRLFDLIRAANYLDIKGLYDLCCKSIAGICKYKMRDNLQATFNELKKDQADAAS